MEVLDLRGASVCIVDADKFKDKRHKHIFSLSLPSQGTVHLFSCAEGGEALLSWLEATRRVIQANVSDCDLSDSCSRATRPSWRRRVAAAAKDNSARSAERWERRALA